MADSLPEETNSAAREWLTDHEGEGMIPFRAMLDPLQITFRLRPSVWLAAQFGPGFELTHTERHLHITPGSVRQNLLYATLRRLAG